jgi:hypothetical protein
VVGVLVGRGSRVWSDEVLPLALAEPVEVFQVVARVFVPGS